MAKSERASNAAKARWAKKTPEERSQNMREIASRPRERLTAEEIGWFRANRAALAVLIEPVKPPTEPIAAPEQFSEPFKFTAPHDPDAPTSDAARCSICLNPIPDLDLPCPVCVAAGRLAASPPPGHGSDIAELQRARRMAPVEPVNPAEAFQAAGRSDISPLDIQGASPAIETVTVVDAPRISNALRKPPIPPPLPPSRVYTAAETCASCGRLPELHEDRGGPIGHAYQVQPVIP